MLFLICTKQDSLKQLHFLIALLIFLNVIVGLVSFPKAYSTTNEHDVLWLLVWCILVLMNMIMILQINFGNEVQFFNLKKKKSHVSEYVKHGHLHLNMHMYIATRSSIHTSTTFKLPFSYLLKIQIYGLTTAFDKRYLKL